MTLPLHRRIPGTASLPVAGIADLPTPLEDAGALPLLDVACGGVERAEGTEPPSTLWVKRDDLTSAVYGGNKVRKLDFLLGDAVKQGRRAVITFGAYGSNHALATAVHATALGLEPHVVLSPQEPGPYAPRTLLAHARIGTHLHLTDGWDGRREAVEAKRALTERDGIEPYVIPMGGTCVLGALGYVNAALEVAEQVEAGEAPAPDVVYVAAGTLGTAVGLALGFTLAGLPTRVEAVRVTPAELVNVEVARKLADETIAMLRSLDSDVPPIAYEDLALSIREEFFDPGYGVVTDATTAAVEAAAGVGLKLETTYTGKAFSAMSADACSGRLGGKSVLFWDTYNSAPYPEAGRVEDLPQVLQEYVAECERLFGRLD